MARVISVSTPKGFAAANARLGSFTAAGDLWIVARLAKHATTSLAEIDPQTGQLLASVSLPVVLSTPLTLGPEGNTWFAGGAPDSHEAMVGYVTDRGDIHKFAARLPDDGAEPLSLVAGPGGLVWFNALDDSGNTWIGHVSHLGEVSIVRYSPFTFTWNGSLIFTPAGTLFTTEEISAVQIPLREGRPRTVAPVLAAEASAGQGNLLAWDNDQDPALVTSTGSVTDYPWLDRGSTPKDAIPGALLEAADGNTWFAASESTVDQDHQYPSDPVLGQITSQGTVTTWPAAFAGPDGGPVGDDLASNQDALEPGPDGRLWAIGYDPYFHGFQNWRLYAVALPGASATRVATAQIISVHGSGHTVKATVACSGQPGRPCAGQITVTQDAHGIARESYAVNPSYTQTYTLTASAAIESGSRLIVSARDPETGMTRTVAKPVN